MSWFPYIVGVSSGSPVISDARILLVGDSTTFGRGANPAGVAGVEGAHIDAPARQLSRALMSLGYESTSNSVVGMGNNSLPASTEGYYNSTPDVGVSLGDWTTLEFDSVGGDIYQSTGAGILTFSFDNVDSAAIGVPVRTYGIIQYRVDGGVWIQEDARM